MAQDRDVLQAAARLADAGEPFVLITVVKTQGSTPRDAGAKMIWRARGPHGTVGGGQFELLVLDAARTHFERESCGMEKYVLGADADQCCGGVMEVFFEFHGSRKQAVVFGAGHVAQALAKLLEPSALDVVVVDDRADWNSAERFPSARRVLSWDAGVDAACSDPTATLACVMTCSHDTDFDLLRRLLESPPAFVGLIGSRSKRACLFGRLVASGIDEARVQSVQCPIGVGDTGKEPRLVAISIAAELLIRAKSLVRS